jgi:hypothetical protein
VDGLEAIDVVDVVTGVARRRVIFAVDGAVSRANGKRSGTRTLSSQLDV